MEISEAVGNGSEGAEMTGATVQAQGEIYKAAVQLVILY